MLTNTSTNSSLQDQFKIQASAVESLKVLFICGGLQPGRDGVGDYVRRLAAEMISQGHQAGIIALNDAQTKQEINDYQLEGGNRIPILRLPSSYTYKSRYGRAETWLKSFDPSWISLQFVPFSFHRKGLPFTLARSLSQLGKGRKWQIMFHELWVGMDKESPFKMVAWGFVQKQIIRSLIKKLAPEVIHTQTLLYKSMLQRIGFPPQHLPLFSNIPSVPYSSRQESKPNSEIRFILFGSIHHGVNVTALANEASLFSKKYGLAVKLQFVGRNGNEINIWQTAWQTAGLPIELLGERSSSEISDLFSKATLGISTTPAPLIEKSGAVAAMLEHGVRVLCISRPWNPRGRHNIQLPVGIKEYLPGNLEELIMNTKTFGPYNTITTVTKQFVNNLLSV